METKGLKTTFLEVGHGYGAQELEILALRHDDPNFHEHYVREFIEGDTAALHIADDSATGALRETLDWIGEHSKKLIIPASLNSEEELDTHVPRQLSMALGIRPDSPSLLHHSATVTTHIKNDIAFLRPLFNFEDGFNVDFVTAAFTSPQWHIDHKYEDSPSYSFARAVRCAHEKSSLIALRDNTVTTLRRNFEI